MLFEPSDLTVKDASFSYVDGFSLRHISLQVYSGQMVGLLGPNGSGKTTLLKLATGILTPGEGEVDVGGVSLRKLSRKQAAQRIAVVPQQFNIPFAYTVAEVVLLGRTPFVHGLAGEDEEDRQIALEAMTLCGMTSFKDRYFNDLSGGERQKAVLAMALAQEPTLLILDEPTAHLDINHQVEIMELLRKLNHEKKVTIIAAIHDLNLASLYFDRLILLDHGSVFADGSPEEVITKKIISQVFSAQVEVSRHPRALVPQITIIPSDNHLN
jgi:iron complex transport system ATP-binding protein